MSDVDGFFLSRYIATEDNNTISSGVSDHSCRQRQFFH